MPLAIEFSFEIVHLPLRYEWKLSRNSSTFKKNGLIRAFGQGKVGLGEAAPNIRYGETPEVLEVDFEKFLNLYTHKNPEQSWADFLQQLPVCQALKMGLDMAFQRLRAATDQTSLASVLGLANARPRPIAYTIPVMDVADIEAFITSEKLHRFSWLKVKVHRSNAEEAIHKVLELTRVPLAIDGNEAWTDPAEVVAFGKRIGKERILFLEQPLPAAQRADYEWLGQHSTLPIWGDESVLYMPEPDYWKRAFAGINVKLMKAGSFENAINLLKTARQAGLQTMIGCMVETTVGIAAALSLESLADYMDLDGFLVIENEAYQWVGEESGVVEMAAQNNLL